MLRFDRVVSRLLLRALLAELAHLRLQTPYWDWRDKERFDFVLEASIDEPNLTLSGITAASGFAIWNNRRCRWTWNTKRQNTLSPGHIQKYLLKKVIEYVREYDL